MDAVDIFETALENFSDAFTCFEEEDPTYWLIEGICQTQPNMAELDTALALATKVAGLAQPPVVTFEKVAGRNWLKENLLSFPPMQAGRFFIHGTHFEQRPPYGSWPMKLDAATAFGSGEHPTTRGCLLAIDHLARRRRPHRILDMGCGSGILSLAAAKAFHAPLLAADMDPESVRVTKENLRANHVAANTRVVQSAGFSNFQVRKFGAYDLILANILARPLIKMAKDMIKVAQPGATVVLSGLMTKQEMMVLNAYTAQGFRLRRCIRIAPWSTLVLQAPPKKSMQ
jgi:ribosomal protein L11 methyltransferase